jgi:hypothetical protein
MRHVLLALVLVLLQGWAGSGAWSQDFAVESYQVSDRHRYQEGAMGAFWGHHLGHMVRTSTRGLWYVDDTGTDVNYDSEIAYFRFDGHAWTLMKSSTVPTTVQQNTVTLAVGDSLFTYGVNISGGYIEEAVFDTKTNTGAWNRRIRFIGGNTNYIGAAVSPTGTRIVWWTRVVSPSGPSDWVYMYNNGSGWSSSITSSIPGDDFSYVFASFLNDSTFYVGGEVPSGYNPWTYEAGAGKVVIGKPIAEFTKMKGDNFAANSIWVNRATGDVHLLTYGSYGGFGYYYKPAGGAWTDTVALADNIGNVSRCRFIDPDDGNLYLIGMQSTIVMMVIPKASITGKIDFASYPIVPLCLLPGFTASYSIWAESPEYQTNPVDGVNFAFPGNDYSYSRFLRHIRVTPNPGNINMRLLMPNGLEQYQGNTPEGLVWYHRPASGIDSVRIQLSTNGGLSWSTVASGAPNTGSYNWKTPALSSPTCRIRISDAGAGADADTSDANFTLSYTQVILKPPVATILRPTKDTTVRVGASMTFQGIGADTDGYVVNYVWKTGDGRTVKGIAKSFDHSYLTVGTYVATLQVQDNDTLWSVPDSVTVTVTPATGVDPADAAFPHFGLYPNYPNPFNPSTTIRYEVSVSGFVRLTVCDLLGREVGMLVDEMKPPGTYGVTWNASGLASGWYLLRLRSNEGVRTQKVLLLR